jgi:DNA polymerase III delta prime subunit
MRKKIEIYSSQNVISLTTVFVVLFFLLYQIGSFLHKSNKINNQIEKIRMTNIKMEEKIKEKQIELAYLKTPERIEKEAKIQMGKKREGEKVLVFVEEKVNLLPTEKKIKERNKIYSASNIDKWKWVFWGNTRLSSD